MKTSENKAAQPRGNKKEELVNSLANNNVVEIEELKEQAGTVDNPEDVADLIKKYEEILKLKRLGIISVAYHQGKVFSRFREKEKFVRLVADFGVHKGTIIFKINVFRLLNKYTGLKKIFGHAKFYEELFQRYKTNLQSVKRV